MKLVKLLLLILGLGFTAIGSAVVGFYTVNIINAYPYTGSTVQLDPDVSPNFFPNVASYYCPQPPNVVGGQVGQFVFLCGSNRLQAASFNPYVIYALYDQNGKKVLTCQLNYAYANGNCTAQVVSSNDAGVAKCFATVVISGTGGCVFNFKFNPKIAGE